MNGPHDTVLSEFERLFTRWLHIKADLEADVRVMGEQPDAQMLSERLLEVQKELTQLLDKPRAELINLSPIEQANLQRMGYALAAYWDDFLLQRFDWGNFDATSKSAARHNWLSLLVEWAVFGTRSAGRGFPGAVKDLTYSDSLKQSDAPLLLVYLRILWLGFGPPTETVIAEHQQLRDDIVAALRGRFQFDSDDFELQPLGWMPPSGLVARRLAPIQRWKKLVVIAAAGFLVLSLTAWLGIVFRLSSILTAME